MQNICIFPVYPPISQKAVGLCLLSAPPVISIHKALPISQPFGTSCSGLTEFTKPAASAESAALNVCVVLLVIPFPIFG